MKKRTLGLMAVSAALAMGAALLANNWAANRRDAASENSVNVVVASTAIPYGQVIAPQHVRLVSMDKGTVPDNTFDQTEHVIGKLSKISQLPGDVLRRERFTDVQDGSTLAMLIGKNMRAITVRVDDVIGVAGFLLPGNRVDVLATQKNGSSRKVESKTVLNNIKVLAVDQSASTDQSKPVIVRAVTLEMEPSQAEMLVKARDEGKIQLALRNPLDESEPEVEPEATPEPKPTPRVAKRAAPRVYLTTVIRGTDISTVRR